MSAAKSELFWVCGLWNSHLFENTKEIPKIIGLSFDVTIENNGHCRLITYQVEKKKGLCNVI